MDRIDKMIKNNWLREAYVDPEMKKSLMTFFSTFLGKRFSALLLLLKSRQNYLAVFFLLCSTVAFAQADQLMEQANLAYADKQYERAKQMYEQLLSDGYQSEVLHYNLGNAYFQTRELGKAILHYEKARKMAPSDEDILYNLEVANARQVDQLEDIPAFFLNQWWKSLRSRLSTNAWTSMALLLLWGSAAGFIFWMMGKERTQRKRGFLFGCILLICSAIPFSLAFDRSRYDQRSQEAILVEKQAQLHFAPDSISKVILTIHEGLKLDLQDKIKQWYKVRLPNGEIGWLPMEVLEEI